MKPYLKFASGYCLLKYLSFLLLLFIAFSPHLHAQKTMKFEMGSNYMAPPGENEYCIDWYLVTYSNGVEIANVYLYTECHGSYGVGGGGSNTKSTTEADYSSSECSKSGLLGIVALPSSNQIPSAFLHMRWNMFCLAGGQFEAEVNGNYESVSNFYEYLYDKILGPSFLRAVDNTTVAQTSTPLSVVQDTGAFEVTVNARFRASVYVNWFTLYINFRTKVFDVDRLVSKNFSAGCYFT